MMGLSSDGERVGVVVGSGWEFSHEFLTDVC